MIDLDRMPADWKFAQEHAKAIRPGIVQTNASTDHASVYCPCCLKPILKTEVPLGGNSKQLQFMGFGFPLYFIFLKYCIILLLILICSYSSLSLYWALTDNYQFCNTAHRLLSSAADPYCTSFMIRFARIQSTVEKGETILRIISFLLHLMALIYIRDHIQKTKEYYDEKTTTLSDYSLIFKNLPLKNGIQADIVRFVNQNFEQQWNQLKKIYSSKQFQSDKKVIQITLLPHTQNYYQLIHQKKHLIEQKRKIMIKQQKEQQLSKKGYTIQRKASNKIHNQNLQPQNQISAVQFTHQPSGQILSQIHHINQQLRKKSKQIVNVCEMYQQLNAKDQLQSQIAIVTLNTQIFKKTVLDFIQDGKLDRQMMVKYFGQLSEDIEISEAPQPTQIIWENVNYPTNKRFGRRIIGLILTVVFLGLTTVVFYILLLLKTQNLLSAIEHHDSSSYTSAVVLVFISLLLIVFFNKMIMGWVLHHFTHLEKHYDTFEDEFSFALKYTLGLFFTTAIMTLAVQAITFHNFFAHQYGVIQQQSIMFFINAFLIPMIWLFNPWQQFQLFRRWLHKGQKHLTQGQANQIMSDCGYVMGKRYAEIIETMWFTFLYSTLIPGGAFLTCIGLALYYWVDKYNLLRRSSLKNNISGNMAIISLKLLDLTLLMRGAGELLFDYQIRDGFNVASIVLVVIGALYFVLPISQILQYVHEEVFKQQDKSFQSVKHLFLETYKTLHPIFGNKKSMKIFQQLKKKKHRQAQKQHVISASNMQSQDLIIDQIFLKSLDQNKLNFQKKDQQKPGQGRTSIRINLKQPKNSRSKMYDQNSADRPNQPAYQTLAQQSDSSFSPKTSFMSPLQHLIGQKSTANSQPHSPTKNFIQKENNSPLLSTGRTQPKPNYMNGIRQVKGDKTTRKEELSLDKMDRPKENDIGG